MEHVPQPPPLRLLLVLPQLVMSDKPLMLSLYLFLVNMGDSKPLALTRRLSHMIVGVLCPLLLSYHCGPPSAKLTAACLVFPLIGWRANLVWPGHTW